MPMALNLFDLVSEDHHPTQSHRFRVRPMTKVYSLRDMKREMGGGGAEGLQEVEAFIQTYSELFS
jgi:hypothetical protein